MTTTEMSAFVPADAGASRASPAAQADRPVLQPGQPVPFCAQLRADAARGEAGEFMGFYESWRAEIAAAGVALDPLFQTVRIEAARPGAGSEPELHWWGAASVAENAGKLQRARDGIVTAIGEHDHCVRHHGIGATLRYLWDFRGDPVAVAAVLTAASLRPRLFRSCEGYVAIAETLAARAAFDRCSWLYESAMTYLKTVAPGFTGWWPTLKLSLPEPVGVRPAAENLPKVLAAEHATLIGNWCPVVVETVFDEGRKAAVSSRTGHRSAVWYADRRRKAAERYAAEREERLQNAAVRQSKWASMSNEELERLVWTKPTRLLAMEYGVSDVAIAKRCRKAGIAKPARGFWRNVEKGYIPHPNGVRPGSDGENRERQSAA